MHVNGCVALVHALTVCLSFGLLALAAACVCSRLFTITATNKLYATKSFMQSTQLY